MDIALWFALTMALAHAYAFRLRSRFGDAGPDTELGVGMGLFWTVVVGACSLAFYAANLKEIFKGADLKAALTLAGGLICYQGSYLGLRYWNGPGWERVSRLIAFSLAAIFLVLPGSAAAAVVGNAMLALFSVGAGCLIGRRATRGFAYTFFSALAVFDAYAVWYSDVMSTILAKAPAAIPSGFVHLSGLYALGAGDVLFSAMGTMIIMRWCGWRWSVAACMLYVLAMDPRWLLVISGILAPGGSSGYFPLMITVCPITMGILALGSRISRRDDGTVPRE